MNIEQAKQIPIHTILDAMGISPTKHNDREAWYLSPWRKEKTASFHVTHKTNLWYDFGETKAKAGGNAFDLVIRHLTESREDHTPVDALRWLRNMGLGTSTHIAPVKKNSRVIENLKGWKVLKVQLIQQNGLIQYLESRGIPLHIGKQHLFEAHVESQKTKRRLYALAFKNEEGGYELRNPFLKSCIAPKGISFVRGNGLAIHVFEGWPDFVSILAQRDGKALDEDVLVLNSISNMKMARAYILPVAYQKLYTWMNNDEAGKLATQLWKQFAKTQEGLTHVAMNKEYARHKDVNEAHKFELGLK